MNRRGFFKALGAIGATVVVPMPTLPVAPATPRGATTIDSFSAILKRLYPVHVSDTVIARDPVWRAIPLGRPDWIVMDKELYDQLAAEVSP